MAPDEELLEPPKRKGLPFKRTVARKQQSSAEVRKPEDDNDLDLFRHSKEVFPEILREAEEAGQGKDQQQHDNKRRKLSSSSPDEPTYSRKRSTTLDGSDDDLIMDLKGKGKEVVRAIRPSTPAKPAAPRATPRTPASRQSASINPAGSPAFPVTILDSDDEDAIPAASPSRLGKNPHNPPTTRRSGLRGTASSSSPIEILDDVNPTNDAETPDLLDEATTTTTTNNNPATDDFSEWVAKARAIQAQESQQAVVQVIVSSQLPGAARPVLARRRLNQGVRLLLETWIANTQRDGVEIPDAVAASLFLTWKGNKIYSHSTLASLGVQVDARGAVRNNRGEGYRGAGIELEVWTEEAYAEYAESRGRERALRLGGGADGEDGASGAESEDEAPPPPVQQRKKGIRIVLKARDHEPLKLTTREDTSVETLIEAFRTQRNVGAEWEVAIWFDGERLDEDSLVTDVDIDPDDANQLEVHVKKVGG